MDEDLKMLAEGLEKVRAATVQLAATVKEVLEVLVHTTDAMVEMNDRIAALEAEITDDSLSEAFRNGAYGE